MTEHQPPPVPVPVAPRRAHVRDLHGEQVQDDYFWMRDLDDPALLAYLDAENTYYASQTGDLTGLRTDIADSLRRRVPVTSHGCPWRLGGWVYQSRFEIGAQYRRTVRSRAVGAPYALGDDAEVVLDLERVAAGAAYLEVGVEEVSDDGRWLAYSVDLTGDEVYELRFRDLVAGRDLTDRVPRTYYGGAWTADGSGFYYTVHDETYRPCQVMRHRLGTDVTDDVLVYEEADRRFEVEVRRTRSGDVVVVTSASRTTCHQLVLDAHDPDAEAVPLRPRVAGVEDHVEHQRTERGGRWLLVTNEGAPEFRLLTADVVDLTSRWRELVPGRPDQRLERCEAFADHVVLVGRRDARPVLEVLTGTSDDTDPLWVCEHPDPAGTVVFGRTDDVESTGFVVGFTGLVEPMRWHLVPFDQGGEWPLLHADEAPGHDPAHYRTERLEVVARDGALIPVTVAYDERTPLDGTAPGLLWGYGSYESCEWPTFDPVLPEWLDRGFVYALTHLRGGGERGRAWWDAGHLGTKTTTFRDHIDVADALVARKYVAGGQVATRGLSAGGLLQGAVLSMRPDRWAAVVAEVPFVDCVTSMLDDSIPLTVNEWEEWGNPAVAAEYAWLRGYAPYENLPEAVPGLPWPSLLVTGALHDPRVLVHEPAKWVAALRRVAPDQSRVLFRAETGPGAHTGPAGRYAALDYEAEVMAWVLRAIRR